MNNSDEAVKLHTSRLMRIINKHGRIEESPIRLGTAIGLTAKEVHVIQTIGTSEGINIKSIGETLGVTKSAASQMVSKLERKGFITKNKAPDNDKEILTFLTPDGWQAFEAHKEFHERHLHTLKERLGDFPDHQLALASAILAVVETVVDERMAELFPD